MPEMCEKAIPTAMELAQAIVDAANNYHDKGLSLFDLLCSHNEFSVNMEGTEGLLASVTKGGPLRHLRKSGEMLEMVAVGQISLSLAGHTANLLGKGSFHIKCIRGDQLDGGLLDILARRKLASYHGYLIHRFTGLSFHGPLGSLVGSVFVFHKQGLVYAAARVAGIWLLPPDL
jgi:hypothetical protein